MASALDQEIVQGFIVIWLTVQCMCLLVGCQLATAFKARSHVGCNYDTIRMGSLYEQSLVTDIVHVLIIVTLLRKRRGGGLCTVFVVN